MQRLLVLYFVGLFIFAGLIFVADKAEREQQSLTKAEESRSQEDTGSATDRSRVVPGASSSQQAAPDEHKSQQGGTEPVEAMQATDRPTASDTSHQSGERTVVAQEDQAFELPYLALGYKSVPDAVRDCEMRYMQKIYLPFYTPPIEFTHQLAICSTHYTDRDYLEVNYLHETRRDHRYMILMRPSKYGIEVAESRVMRRYELNDGSEALLSLTPEEGYHVLTFDRWGWQYMLVVPKKLESVFTPDEMVRVANSIQSESSRRVAWRY